MKKIRLAIDINDTYRGLTKQFALQYYKINPSVNPDNLEYTEEDFYSPFPFNSRTEFNRFRLEDYHYEIYAMAKTVERNTQAFFNIWLNKLSEYDYVYGYNGFDLSFICPDEHNLAIQSTLFFLSKTASRVRTIKFPLSTAETYESADVVLSANPVLLKAAPEGKITVKITTDYNKSVKADYTYSSLNEFINDEETYTKLLKMEL
jgi:hypothetical protein